MMTAETDDIFEEDDDFEGDGHPGRPPAQVDNLWRVVEKHFPAIDRTDNFTPDSLVEKYGERLPDFDAERLVEDHDSIVCWNCAQTSFRTFRKTVDQPIGDYRYPRPERKVNPPSTVAILKRKLNAIQNRNVTAWLKAEVESTSAVQMAEADAADQLDVFHVRNTNGALAARALGPSSESIERHVEMWMVEMIVLAQAIRSTGRPGRPSTYWRDEAVREIVELWRVLSGREPKQPSKDALMAASDGEGAGSMVAFVRDAMAVYSEFGLSQEVKSSLNSSFWSRILTQK